jgi:hypothetical protein
MRTVVGVSGSILTMQQGYRTLRAPRSGSRVSSKGSTGFIACRVVAHTADDFGQSRIEARALRADDIVPRCA